tara:strand:- start:1575 stop:2138 length:564 start_codon:yes stop_codon:yes gene_type:complete
MSANYCTQNQLLLNNLLLFFKKNNNLKKILPIINGESNLSIRVIDWFVTNFAKKYHTVYNCETINGTSKRFKVYIDYKLKLKAYSKQRFDPFCRWERINIPYEDYYIQTTIGQLNFFKWALENKILDYIENNIEIIEKDMNSRNSTAKKKNSQLNGVAKTRKKREELSISAIKSIKRENVEITVKFN